VTGRHAQVIPLPTRPAPAAAAAETGYELASRFAGHAIGALRRHDPDTAGDYLTLAYLAAITTIPDGSPQAQTMDLILREISASWAAGDLGRSTPDRDSIAEARAQLAECEWGDAPDVGSLTAEEVRFGVERHYEGGWQQFLRDGGL
jgi:hypothetical protein